jgi:hypothetical protein
VQVLENTFLSRVFGPQLYEIGPSEDWRLRAVPNTSVHLIGIFFPMVLTATASVV